MNSNSDAQQLIDPKDLVAHINIKLALLGWEPVQLDAGSESSGLLIALAAQYQEKDRLLGQYLCPADQRIQTFLYDYLQDVPVPKLPARTFTLDRPGLARTLSLPVDRDEFSSQIVSSYRLCQGVLHNPKADRRTTQGTFHITEGGLGIPDDKLAVPKVTFARMLALALDPPQELKRLPFTATQPHPAECFVSLLIRPIVCPEAPGFTPEKTMEIRWFAPGNLVSNLDFVESIFGNGGDPLLPQNDAALDTEHWTGHTGCVILAPHLVGATKQSVGLPHWDQATPRQRRDGMCWRERDELYNNGGAFKLTCRDESGVIFTLIADNYYGYCKKEVKTQISFAANLFGAEEEHAGGALVFPAYDLGEEFSGEVHVKSMGHSFKEVTTLYSGLMELKPQGYAVDRTFPELIYVPESAEFDLDKQKVMWSGGEVRLQPGKTYIRPSGYKVRMEKPAGANRVWRLVGVVAEGLLCHKPSTVSGGGKSEISKPITDAILTGPVYVADLKVDLEGVAAMVNRDYSNRFIDEGKVDKRPVLAAARSLGSVIKLLTPDAREFKPEYNAWLEAVPQYIKELVFVVKRYYKPEWGDNWRDHFSVDIVDGVPGNQLKCDNRRLVTTHLRVGFDSDGQWRTFGLRKDFHPAVKVQQEDDITASLVVPADRLSCLPESISQDKHFSLKLVANCEQRLFQRPDEAIHRGYDKQAESDCALAGGFFSNYEPLTVGQACELIEDAVGFDQYTEPMQALIRRVAAGGAGNYFVSSAHPRVVDGKPSKNPRYLQRRPDLVDPCETHLGKMSARLRRRASATTPILTPVGAVLPGRRNSPPEHGIRALACYNPIHYMQLPELFMEFVCSITGKSPSTTGAGSEGALTKGPFNALPPIIDLNSAVVSFILTGYESFVTAAGYVGPKARVDHDISLVAPEVFCRMSSQERDPGFLIAQGFLEKLEDFEHGGKRIMASRLGYRINDRFVHAFFARVFNHPHAVFTPEMLKPELQDLDVYVDGINNIVETQKRIAQMYFDDGSIDRACPPLKALLHIMRDDQWEGKGLQHPVVRNLFTREALLASDWYSARLRAKQSVDRRLWRRHVEYLEKFLKRGSHADQAVRLGLPDRLVSARKHSERVESPDYLKGLVGTIGAEPIQSFF